MHTHSSLLSYLLGGVIFSTLAWFVVDPGPFKRKTIKWVFVASLLKHAALQSTGKNKGWLAWHYKDEKLTLELWPLQGNWQWGQIKMIYFLIVNFPFICSYIIKPHFKSLYYSIDAKFDGLCITSGLSS